MAKRIWLIAGALALGVASPPTTFAKPGDLPVDITQQCPDAREFAGAARFTPPAADVTLADDRFAVPPTTGPETAAVGRSTRPFQRDAGPRPVNQIRDRNHRVRRQPTDSNMTDDEVEAARLFALGERCRQIGDHAQARVCFEEAHIVSPTSVAGRLAIDRLRTIERELHGVPSYGAPLGDAEEAELAHSGQPRRPASPPGDADAPRRPASQSGESPQRQPLRPVSPASGGSKGLRGRNHELKQMLDSTVPLGGAEEQETSRSPGKRQLPYRRDL